MSMRVHGVVVVSLLFSLLQSRSARANCAPPADVRVTITAQQAPSAAEPVTITAHVSTTAPRELKLSWVLPPEVARAGDGPAFHGEVHPGVPLALRDVMTFTRPGMKRIAMRAEAGPGRCRWTVATFDADVAAPRERIALQRITANEAPAAAKQNHPRISGALDGVVRRGPQRRIGSDAQADSDGRILVYLRFREGADVDALLTSMRVTHGVERSKTRGRFVRVRVAPARVVQLVDHYADIELADLPMVPHLDAVAGQGVGVSGARTFHGRGISGAGARVAIIDSGWAGIGASIVSGDLPAGVTLLDCTTDGCESSAFAGEVNAHGTSCAEIVHEMAPAATLFLMKIGDALDLNDVVTWCIANQIDIISMSLAFANANFYDGRCWRDVIPWGPVCAADRALTDGILWVNSAGNFAQQHYDATFTDANGNNIHDTLIQIPNAIAGVQIAVFLTWNAWPMTDQDFDFELVNAAGTIVASSDGAQVAAEPPVEAIFYTPPATTTLSLRVRKYDATTNPRLKIFSYNHQLSPATAASSVSTPADGTWVMSVGALAHQQYTSDSGLQFYSSRGPLSDGVKAPIIAAPTNVSGRASATFGGTSAAAPHVAGGAALLKSANPNWFWSDLWDELVDTSIDMGAVGQDNLFGFGRLNLCLKPSPPGNLITPQSVQSGTPYNVTWSGNSPIGVTEVQESTNPFMNDATTYTVSAGQSVLARQKTVTTTTTFYYRARSMDACNGTTSGSTYTPLVATTVVGGNACAITVTAQSGGEAWTPGGAVNITWQTSGSCGAQVSLELIRGIDSSSVIVSPTSNDGSHLWTLPSDLTAGSAYSIRITDLTTSVVAQRTVSITYPATPAGPRPRADFNRDGRHDFLWRNAATGQVWATTFNGVTPTGGFMVHVEPNTNWRIIGTADFNGDQHSDILWRNFASGVLFVQLLSGGSVIATGFPWTEASTAWQIVDLVDLDNDSRADIVWRNSTTGTVFAILMNGGAPKASGVIWREPDLDWQLLFIADFNGDGRGDLLWRNAATGVCFVVQMNGLTPLASGIIYREPNLSWRIAATGDTNGDGRADLVWRNSGTGQVWITLMNGLTPAGAGTAWYEPNSQWVIHGTGDFNGDGRADLLWRNSANGKVFMNLMNGTAPLASGVAYNEPNLNWKIVSPTNPVNAANGNITP